MTRRLLVTVLAVALALAGSAAPRAQDAVFRADVDLVVVDVVVRDREGGVVRGLTMDDFEVLENGRPQQIRSFDFEEIAAAPAPLVLQPLLQVGAPAPVGPAATPVAGDAPAPPAGVSAVDLAGRRLVVLLFDLSSMQPEDVDRAGRAAITYVEEQMTAADLVAVASIDTVFTVRSDFTADRERLLEVLAAFRLGSTAGATGAATTAATDELAATTTDLPADALGTEFALFSNDLRLRAIRLLADALAHVEQKKAVLYFSGGLDASGGDNQVELRAAINAAVRANVALYPVDSRGLQAVVPGGDASQSSSGGIAAFSGRGVRQQFDSLFQSQDTINTLATDTGGRAFTDTNDFGEAFAQVIEDTSAYYLLGYASTNDTADGRYRRITVRLKRPDLRVEHREGYYAPLDFAHAGRRDREAQLEAQMDAAVSSTDLPLSVAAGWFRVAPDRFYVPVSVAVPGSAVPVTGNRVSLDVLGRVRDERGQVVGRVRDTVQVPRESTGGLAARQVLYQSAVTLPPGRFSLKVVVRENTTGEMGSFEAPVVVPDLSAAPVKMSSITFGTQLREVDRRDDQSPLRQDGVELLPSLTHVVSRQQRMYFLYEVYDAGLTEAARPELTTSLAFYRGRVKVFETPVLVRTDVDATDRGATRFRIEVDAAGLEPGLYTCQVNVIDEATGRFVFPRLAIYVR